MKINIKKNIVIPSPQTRNFLADAFYNDLYADMPLVIFVHGFKGFKDWGAYNIMAMEFAKAGFYFVKLNFSHNGTTVEQPTDFADLEAFGQNSFSKEMLDLDAVLNYFTQNEKVNPNRVALIGHSRGGGISVIKAFEDERVTALITLAGVSNFGYRFPSGERLEKWEKEGVVYNANARTKQEMPMFYQFYEDYKANEERFNIQYAAQHLQKPFLIIQGTDDEAVKANESELLHEWCKHSELFTIQNANHTFGATEPWNGMLMPEDLQKATGKMIDFLQKKI